MAKNRFSTQELRGFLKTGDWLIPKDTSAFQVWVNDEGFELRTDWSKGYPFHTWNEGYPNDPNGMLYISKEAMERATRR